MTARYDLCTGRKDKDGKSYWTKIGVMFPAREGDGFLLYLLYEADCQPGRKNRKPRERQRLSQGFKGAGGA